MSKLNTRSLKLGPVLLVPLLLLASSQAFASPASHTGRSAADGRCASGDHAAHHGVERPDRVQTAPHHKHHHQQVDSKGHAHKS